MEKKGRIRIVSRHHGEMSSKVEVGGRSYLIVTEDAKPYIITRIYLDGKVLSTTKSDYSGILKSAKAEERVHELMTGQHRRALNAFKQAKAKEAKTPSDYMGEARSLLARKSYRNALSLLAEGLEQHPGDPFLMSYYGCLEAVVNKNHKLGIETCTKAIEALKGRLPFGEEFYYPVFYLNLGRAYLAAGRKQEALEAFNVGLKADPESSDLIWEMKKMGLRQSPPVTFLKRSSPINKYIGMLLHRLRK